MDEILNIPALGADVEKHEIFADSSSDTKGHWLKNIAGLPSFGDSQHRSKSWLFVPIGKSLGTHTSNSRNFRTVTLAMAISISNKTVVLTSSF